MRRKALLLSFATHFFLLFLIIVAVTFILKNFNLKIIILISTVYITALSIYFIVLLNVLKSREYKKEGSLEDSKPLSTNTILKYWLLLLLYIGTIFYLSSLSYIPFVSSIEEYDPRRYSLHVIEYLGLGFLMFLAFLNSGLDKKKSAFLTIMFCFSIAFLDEKFQLGIPGRRFNPIDLYSDWAGIIIGTILSSLLIRNRE